MPIQTQKIRPVAAILGWILCIMAGIRGYRLVRFHLGNSLFSPQMFSTGLSFWIATSMLRVGRSKGEASLKEAVTLIRSGFLLMVIWGYRFYQAGNAPKRGMAALSLDILYPLLGAATMITGLVVSRSIRGASVPQETGRP